MAKNDFLSSSLWQHYSLKVIQRIENPHNRGRFTEEDAQERGMHYAEGGAGSFTVGRQVVFYFFVDATDGIVVDTKFQCFGHSALIAIADTVCDLAVNKNYDQVKKISKDLIIKQLQDKKEEDFLPEELDYLFLLVSDALSEAMRRCAHIPLTVSTPVPGPSMGEEGFPGWIQLDRKEKLEVIEKILNEEIRPYIELDEGGIEILDLLNERELIIAYKGACTSCFSSVGATLSSIQQILQSKVYSELVVVPNMDDLKFH